MRPFDLDAAKRGELIEVNTNTDVWEKLYFIGMTSAGRVAFESQSGSLWHVPVNKVRMAPRKVEAWIVLCGNDIKDRVIWSDAVMSRNKETAEKIRNQVHPHTGTIARLEWEE
jgi:hypothetical protein